MLSRASLLLRGASQRLTFSTMMSAESPSVPASVASALSSGGPLQKLLVSRIVGALGGVAHIEIENESHKHSVPPGSESHFKVFVVAEAFAGVKILERHRMVNEACAGGAGLPLPCHALSVQAKTPQQWSSGATLQSTPGCKGGSKADETAPAGSAGSPA
jgi:stress-induced morphogen